MIEKRRLVLEWKKERLTVTTLLSSITQEEFDHWTQVLGKPKGKTAIMGVRQIVSFD